MDIISPDISLTAKILKIANSPFYGLSREINSLQHALTILGFKEIRNLVLSTVVFDSFKNIKENAKFDINEFWKHSFVCGITANIIAAELKKAGNEFFVAGLIHDIGKLVIYITLPTEFFKLIEATGPLELKYMTFQTEKEILGITHDEVGMSLLQKWNFPKELSAAVGFHHYPQKADKDSLLTFVVHTADILAHVYEVSEKGEDGNSLKTGSFYPDIIKLAQTFGIQWNDSDLSRLQQLLVENIERESDALSLFF
jgi:HD-like signal output (HDOD) protein